MPEDNNPSTNSSDKIFDVQDPGQTVPDATARPVVGGSPQQPDPMLNNSEVTSDDSLANLSTPSMPTANTAAPSDSVASVETPAGLESRESSVNDKIPGSNENTLSPDPINPQPGTGGAVVTNAPGTPDPSVVVGSDSSTNPVVGNSTQPGSPVASKGGSAQKSKQMMLYVAIIIVIIIAAIVIFSLLKH